METPVKMLTAETEIAEFVGQYYADLGGYIRAAYPWKEVGGLLENFDGPEYWVNDLADQISNHVAKNGFNGVDPVDPIYVSVASGNGAAKSAFAGMINSWILDTRPMSRVTVSANTGTQLRTKTWPEIDKWKALAITSDWFVRQDERIFHRDHKLKWITNAHTWNIGNTQASAGQHAREASSTFIIDEASHVPEAILEQMDGGLTDGEPFMILLGNCTNRMSRLFRACFGNLKKFYINMSIDTRKCRYTNKAQIAKWIEQRGADSDWCKAHIYGEAPNADDLQLIDSARVQAARKRPVPAQDTDTEPLILGLDFARGGNSDNRLVWRKGRDARSTKGRMVPGEKTRDTTLMVTLISNEINEKKPDAVAGDAGGLGGPIMDRLRQLFPDIPIIDVMFGGAAPDDRYADMRIYIWDEMRMWLAGGCIEDSEELEIELTGPQSYEDNKSKLRLESKDDLQERGLPDPHYADALSTTFCMKFRKRESKKSTMARASKPRPRGSGRGWMRK